MSNIITDVEKGAVNAIAGLSNIFGNIATQVKTSATVATSGATTTASGAAIPPAATASASNATGFVAEIESLIADAEAGNWTNEAEDVVGFLTTGLALLTKFGINVPGLSVLSTVLTTLAPIL